MKNNLIFILFFIVALYSKAQNTYKIRNGHLIYKLYDKNDTSNNVKIDYYFSKYGKLGYLKIFNPNDSIYPSEFIIKDSIIYKKVKDSFYFNSNYTNILELIFNSIGIKKKIRYFELLNERKPEIKFRKFRRYKYYKNFSLCYICTGNIFYIYKNIPISINYCYFEKNGKRLSLICKYKKFKKNKKYDKILKSSLNYIKS